LAFRLAVPRQLDCVVEASRSRCRTRANRLFATKPEFTASSSLTGSRLQKIPRKCMPRLRVKAKSGEPLFQGIDLSRLIDRQHVLRFDAKGGRDGTIKRDDRSGPGPLLTGVIWRCSASLLRESRVVGTTPVVPPAPARARRQAFQSMNYDLLGLKREHHSNKPCRVLGSTIPSVPKATSTHKSVYGSIAPKFRPLR
jgi:hypothetical protein